MIAEDGALFLEALSELLIPEPGLHLIGEAMNGQQLLNQLEVRQPDVVLLDINMPIMDGIETTKIIRELYPNVRILALTSHVEKVVVRRVLKAGVDGYMLKDNSNKKKLLEVIQTIMRGNFYYDPEIADLIKGNSKQASKQRQKVALTKREKEITRLIAQGKNSNEIANTLVISPKTVAVHRRNIFAKLNIKKTAALIAYAYENGLMD
jgi:DNA-binding NarL/FixJ family response regulator